jgi:hypothetical protein
MVKKQIRRAKPGRKRHDFDHPGFTEWFKENRNSETLQDQWQNAVMDCRGTGEKPPTFRQYAKEIYNHMGD